VLSVERAEAELRATATLQARIAAEETLTRKALEAVEAAQHAAAVHSKREEREDALKEATRLRRRLEGRPPRWPFAVAIAGAVMVGLALGLYFGEERSMATVFVSGEGSVRQEAAGRSGREPLRLRLESELQLHRR
jgi:hypothetical protein